MGSVTSLNVITPRELRDYLSATETQQKVVPASAFVEEVRREMFSPKKVDPIVLPWAKTHHQFAFRPGEVTLWAGINGHGKSLMLSQVVLSLGSQGQRICIASFEMKPWRSMERMLRQVTMGDQPSEEWLDLFGKWTDDRIWFYDQQGTVETQWIYAICRYCAQKLRIGHVVIDSLMKCVRGEDDFNAQKSFVDEITSIARDTGIHIHLVHHVRKKDDERQSINKFDIKGSGSITDQVDNVLLVWRNKAKEAEPDKHEKAPDAILTCDKQRNGEWEGRWAFWFHKGSMQYTPDPGCRPIDLLRLG